MSNDSIGTLDAKKIQEALVIKSFTMRMELKVLLASQTDKASAEACSLARAIHQTEATIMEAMRATKVKYALRLAGALYDNHCRRDEANLRDFGELEAWRDEPLTTDTVSPCRVYAFSAGLPGHGRRR